MRQRGWWRGCGARSGAPRAASASAAPMRTGDVEGTSRSRRCKVGCAAILPTLTTSLLLPARAAETVTARTAPAVEKCLHARHGRPSPPAQRAGAADDWPSPTPSFGKPSISGWHCYAWRLASKEQPAPPRHPAAVAHAVQRLARRGRRADRGVPRARAAVPAARRDRSPSRPSTSSRARALTSSWCAPTPSTPTAARRGRSRTAPAVLPVLPLLRERLAARQALPRVPQVRRRASTTTASSCRRASAAATTTPSSGWSRRSFCGRRRSSRARRRARRRRRQRGVPHRRRRRRRRAAAAAAAAAARAERQAAAAEPFGVLHRSAWYALVAVHMLLAAGTGAGVGVLGALHCYLVATKQTTFEWITARRRRLHVGAAAHPAPRAMSPGVAYLVGALRTGWRETRASVAPPSSRAPTGRPCASTRPTPRAPPPRGPPSEVSLGSRPCTPCALRPYNATCRAINTAGALLANTVSRRGAAARRGASGGCARAHSLGGGGGGEALHPLLAALLLLRVDDASAARSRCPKRSIRFFLASASAGSTVALFFFPFWNFSFFSFFASGSFVGTTGMPKRAARAAFILERRLRRRRLLRRRAPAPPPLGGRLLGGRLGRRRRRGSSTPHSHRRSAAPEQRFGAPAPARAPARGAGAGAGAERRRVAASVRPGAGADPRASGRNASSSDHQRTAPSVGRPHTHTHTHSATFIFLTSARVGMTRWSCGVRGEDACGAQRRASAAHDRGVGERDAHLALERAAPRQAPTTPPTKPL